MGCGVLVQQETNVVYRQNKDKGKVFEYLAKLSEQNIAGVCSEGKEESATSFFKHYKMENCTYKQQCDVLLVSSGRKRQVGELFCLCP